MVEQLPKAKIYISGTMRGGSSLVSNVLNAHSEIMVLGEYVHFFRFIYNHYNPLDENNAKRMLREINARLFHRYRVKIAVDDIFRDIATHGFSYKVVYDAIMRYYLNILNKKIAGEDAALNWDTIPEYHRLFPDGKIIQIARDPRSVLASWRKSSYQRINYLGAIFNCIDNLDACSLYSKLIPKANYYVIQYEKLVSNPEQEVHQLCDFLGVQFEPLMIQPEKWNEVFDGVYVKRGWSSHVGKMQKGFDASRMLAWKDSLEDWQICLCEWLAREQLLQFGYELSGKTFNVDTFRTGVDIMKNSKYLYKCFNGWFTKNQGEPGYPDDPRDPATWGATEKKKSLFLDTEDGQNYLLEIQKIRAEMATT